jgi:hypothetical protein
MANTAILAIRIVSDATKAAKELDKVSDKTSRVGKVSAAAGKAFAIGIGAAAVAAVKFGNAAAEDEREAARLAQTLKTAAGATDAQVAATERWITAQGKALGVSDSELRPAISRLAVATGDLGEAQRLAALAMDVSAGSGKSLKSVTEALVRAQNGSVAGLSRMGVATKDAKGNTLALEQITRKLAATYKGAAANAADTQAGKSERLKVRMEELQESIGARLIPVLLALTSAGLAVVGWMEKHQTLTLVLVGAVLGLVGAVAAINGVMKAYTAITAAWAAVTKAAAAAQRLLNLAMRANPIGLIITAVIALVALLVVLYKKNENVRRIIQAVGRFGAQAIGWIVSKVTELVRWVGERAVGAWNTLKPVVLTVLKIVTAPTRFWLNLILDVVKWVKDKLPAAFNAAKSVVVNAVNAMLAPFRLLKDLIDKILGAISKIKLPDLPDVGGGVPFIPGIRAVAGAGVTINVPITIPNGFVGSESQLARALAPAFGRELERISRRPGR